MSETERSAARTKAGFVAIAGAPNVGKSTLLNRILGQALSIITPKPQTTRTRILGVHTVGDTQIVFCDTPGIHHETGLLHQRMNAEARSGVREANVVCWLIDASRGLRRIDRDEASSLDSARTIVVINKCDAVGKPSLLPLIQSVAQLLPDSDIVPISALGGEGVDRLVELLLARMPEGQWFFDADQITDQTERSLVAELVREQLFLQLEAELPYRVAVLVEEFRDLPNHTSISATIYTDSESSKRIIVGKGGARIKSVGIEARQAIERLLDRRVFLELFVKVKPGWQEDPRFLKEMGL